MLVAGEDTLFDYGEKHSTKRDRLEQWLREARNAMWKSPNDVTERYAKASTFRGSKVVFRVSDNCRLLVRIDYKRGRIRILDVADHDTYDKKWNLG